MSAVTEIIGDVTSFADAIAIEQRSATGSSAEFDAHVPEDWGQGRTAFGGVAAALLIRAAESLPGMAGIPIRSVDTAFVGPLPPGPATISAKILRCGKYLNHVSARILAEHCQEPAATVHVVFGGQRDSAAVVADPAVKRTPIDDCITMPYIEGMTPRFTRNMEFRYASGIPFSGSASPTVSGYCRHREPVFGVAAVAGLVDGWPGAVMALLDAPAPASSVRWSLHRPHDAHVDGGAWHWYEAETVAAAGGHATITARLYTEDDQLVAWSEQLMAVFDKPKSEAGTR